MKVLFETTWLAPGDYQSAAQVRVNGKQIVDEAFFFRAASATPIPRGNLTVEFSFVTHWNFDTTTLAENFVMTHSSFLPMTNADNGPLQVMCGAESSPLTVYSQTAVLESAEVVSYIGRSVDVRYTLRCSPFTTSIPPNIPNYQFPDVVSYVLQRGVASIGAGATQLAISFTSPFGSKPIVVATMSQMTGSRGIDMRILQDTITVSGFTVEFSAPLPDSSSQVNWMAMQ
jgi:hypothetical protein